MTKHSDRLSYKAQNERYYMKILELESEIASLAIALDDATQVNNELRETLRLMGLGGEDGE